MIWHYLSTVLLQMILRVFLVYAKLGILNGSVSGSPEDRKLGKPRSEGTAGANLLLGLRGALSRALPQTRRLKQKVQLTTSGLHSLEVFHRMLFFYFQGLGGGGGCTFFFPCFTFRTARTPHTAPFFVK